MLRMVFFLLMTLQAPSFADPWMNGDWKSRAMVTGFGNPPAPLADFPVIVKLTNFMPLRTAKVTGEDICFAGADGWNLFHEIEYFDPDTGSLLAWVCLPTYSNYSSIYMYWSNENTNYLFVGSNRISVLSNTLESLRSIDIRTNVWDTNFAFVMHFSERKSNLFQDSSRRAFHASYQGSPGYVFSTNQFLGPAMYVKNSTADNSGVRIDSMSNALEGALSFTVSSWVNIQKDPTNHSLDRNIILWSMRGNDSDKASNGVLLNCFPGGNSSPSPSFTNNQQSNWEVVGGGEPLLTKYYTGTNTWYKFCTVSDASTGIQFSYLNGRISNARSNQVFSNRGTSYVQGPLYIAGHSSGSSKNCNGIYDEFRISTVARQPLWIQSEVFFESPTYASTAGPTESVTFDVPILFGNKVANRLKVFGTNEIGLFGVYLLTSEMGGLTKPGVCVSDTQGLIDFISSRDTTVQCELRPPGRLGLDWIRTNVQTSTTNSLFVIPLSSGLQRFPMTIDKSQYKFQSWLLPASGRTFMIHLPGSRPMEALLLSIRVIPVGGGGGMQIFDGLIAYDESFVMVDSSKFNSMKIPAVYLLEFSFRSPAQDEKQSVIMRKMLFLAR